MNDRGHVRAWAWYDFANSSYVLVYQAYLLPVYFVTRLPHASALLSWGLVNAISTALGVLLSVLIGMRADRARRLEHLRAFVWLSFLGMIAVSACVALAPSYVPLTYTLANTAFIVTLSLSDSMLPFLSNNRGEALRASGYAWGFGYVGGILAMPIVFAAQRVWGDYSAAAFGSVALFYIVFSNYSFRGLQTAALNAEVDKSAAPPITTSQRVMLLVGVWLISEAITVIILFFSTYASAELKLSTTIVGAMLLGVQLIGWPSTIFGGRLGTRYNDLNLLGVSIALWVAVLVILLSHPSMAALAVVVVLTGLVIGNSQSYLRAQYSDVVFRWHSGRDYGIYAIASEVSVIIGPVLYGWGSDRLGSQRIPLMTLAAAMLVGYVVVRQILRRR